MFRVTIKKIETFYQIIDIEDVDDPEEAEQLAEEKAEEELSNEWISTGEYELEIEHVENEDWHSNG